MMAVGQIRRFNLPESEFELRGDFRITDAPDCLFDVVPRAELQIRRTLHSLVNRLIDVVPVRISNTDWAGGHTDGLLIMGQHIFFFELCILVFFQPATGVIIDWNVGDNSCLLMRS